MSFFPTLLIRFFFRSGTFVYMCILCVFCVQLSCFTKNFFFASHFFVDIFFSFRSYTFYFCVILAVVLYPEQKNYWYFEMYEVVSFHLFFGIIKLDGSLFVAFFMLVVSEVFSQILLICVCFTWKFLPVDDEILKWLSLFVVFILLFLFCLNVFVLVFFWDFFFTFFALSNRILSYWWRGCYKYT